MEKLLEQMKGYLNMDTEIPFEEFNTYYQEVLAYLQPNYESFNEDQNIKGRYILSIIAANAEERSKGNKNLAKKYKKIGQKATLWAEALTYRLLKQGMTQEQINMAEKELNDSI